jgi:hypothetical protein
VSANANQMSVEVNVISVCSAGMESSLHARDVVGVHDFVLLENYGSEDAFVDNLKKRFQGDMIYVSTP